jgi:N-acylneuraminate cytidylyltransferase/CMP-N,N'-diacetyllegionaminic acid synthase
VISVTDLGKYPNNLRFMDDSELSMAFSGQDRNAQRQGLKKLYGVNGSIFLARPQALKTYGTFHVEGALGYLMDQIRSVDINEPADLELAAQLYHLMQNRSSVEGKS